MKRVLIIAYYWPPAGGSGVQRWVKFAKYLPSDGWQPVVCTPLNPEYYSKDETLARDVPPEAEVLRLKITEPYGIYRRLMGKSSSTDMKTLTSSAADASNARGESSDNVNPISAEHKSLKQKISLWVRANLFIPDPRIWWLGPCSRQLEKYLKEHPVDVIVTTGPPQSMHLIGRRLSKATGIPWVADFRDPWTKMFYFKHLPLTKYSLKKHLRLEKAVLDDATAVIAVTPLVQKDFQVETSTPVRLITNGFDEDDFAKVNKGLAEGRENKFRAVHTGIFAADGNPLALWDVLAEQCRKDEDFRNRLEIRLAGKVDEAIVEAIRSRGLGDNLVLIGYVSHERAVAEQQCADLLLLPLRQEPEYRSVLPGKIFEYLAARRPVLGIGQPDGIAAKVLEDSGAGVMRDWDDVDGIRETVQAVFEGRLSCDSDADLEKYTRRSLTGRLAGLLNNLSK
jgi:hypothetical protein